MRAAAELLAEQGVRGTTTMAVASCVGMSQGALFKHFPTKVELLAGGIEAALDSLVVAFRVGLPRRPPASVEGRLNLGIDALWRVFRLPAMQGIFEVFLAARTDAELGQVLEPLLATHRANIHAEARALLRELADEAPSALEAGVDAVVCAMQGAALGLFSNDETRERELIAFFRRLAVHELAAARAGERR